MRGTDYKTRDGTCVRDYIDVTDLIDAHVKALAHARPGKVGIYNVGTGKGVSFVTRKHHSSTISWGIGLKKSLCEHR